jgi:hypothetical protein
MSRDQPAQPHSPRSSHKVQGTLLSVWWAVAAIIAPGVHADNGRDFSALYNFGSAQSADSTHVSVQLYLSLQNHSGAAVRNTAILLVQPGLLETDATEVASSVTVANRAVALVSGTLTIDSQEYQRWQRGQWTPLLYLRVTDAQGHQVDRRIELARRPGLGARP